MNLVIVESPSKIKTIKQYLGEGYNVVATKGHIRDIALSGIDNLGIDVNNGFKPVYTIIKEREATVKMLNKEVEEADKVYLATDPDREGEAISWHLNEVLKLKNKYVKRIEFNEITEPAIHEALNNPRDINENLFESQETRKIIDRIIGFRLSNLLKRKIGSETQGEKVSAGRVQSAALKLIIDREKAINDFIPVVHYEVEVDNKKYKLKLCDTNNYKNVYSLNTLEEAYKIVDSLSKNYKVVDVINTKRYEKAQPPFTTSTLIQAALNKYNMSSERTMKIAQQLYEGVDINNKHIAFITYMRTDSTRISDVFKQSLSAYIINEFGTEYLGYLHQKNNNENIQDAHEAIRPVSLKNSPDKYVDLLSKEQYQIYSLIYNHTLESMMKDEIIDVTTVIFENNGYFFKSTFEKTSFKGFKITRNNENSEKSTFSNAINDIITINDKPSVIKKESEGPKKFSEATLIKEMELSGIGRPSTYASTIKILRDRNYVTSSKKKITPTSQGSITSHFLDEYFDEIINIEYTANMEKLLDEVALGKTKQLDILNDFYSNFTKIYNERKNNIKVVETGELCPCCGSKMVYRSSKFGRFEACSNYPTCKYIKKQEKVEMPEIECPTCHIGHLVEKKATHGKYKGKIFYACNRYPDCNYYTSVIPKIKKV